MDNDNNEEKTKEYPIVKVDKDSLKKAIIEKKFDLIKHKLEQVPNFVQGATSLLETIKTDITSNDNSMKQYVQNCSLLIEALKTEIGKDISQDTKNKYINDIKEILDKIYQKDTENKNWLLGMFAIGGALLIGGIKLLSAWNNSDDSNDNLWY